MKIIIAARILLSILILMLLYDLFDIFREIKEKGYFKEIIGDFNESYLLRKQKRESAKILEGENEKKTFIEKIDLLVERSGIRAYSNKITTEIIIIGTIIMAFISSVVFYAVVKLFIFVIPIFLGVIFLVYLILGELARRTYDKIDDQLLMYINTLENFSFTSSDIVEIMEKSLPYIKEPLKNYSKQFVFQCKKGLSIVQAFKNFEDKVESLRFKQLIKNLAICSKYQANYREILGKSRVIIKNYYTEKTRRQKEIKEGRIAIVVTMAVGALIISQVVNVCPNFKDQMLHSFLGNILVGYNIFVVMFAIFKFITLDKINY